MFSFMASYLLFWKEKKIGDRKRYDPWKNSKKKKKTAQKNIIILCSTLNCTFGLEKVEIWFSLFLEKLYRIEFSLDKKKKKTNIESIGILHRKLEPKYEIGSKDNTSSASSSTSFQNSNRDQHQIRSSLFK